MTLENRDEVLAAIAGCEDAGLDVAGALHLARSSRCAAFVTFDKRLAKRAAASGRVPAAQLLR